MKERALGLLLATIGVAACNNGEKIQAGEFARELGAEYYVTNHDGEYRFIHIFGPEDKWIGDLAFRPLRETDFGYEVLNPEDLASAPYVEVLVRTEEGEKHLIGLRGKEPVQVGPEPYANRIIVVDLFPVVLTDPAVEPFLETEVGVDVMAMPMLSTYVQSTEMGFDGYHGSEPGGYPQYHIGECYGFRVNQLPGYGYSGCSQSGGWQTLVNTAGNTCVVTRDVDGNCCNGDCVHPGSGGVCEGWAANGSCCNSTPQCY